MGTQLFTGRLALIATAAAAAFTTACAAQDASVRTQTVRVGQSNVLIAMPDTTPAPASYALTGEPNQSHPSLVAWQKQAGPVYTFGNGSVLVAPSR